MRFVLRVLFLVALAAVLAAGFRSYVAEGIYIASASMDPTLPVGTHLFLDKLTYRLRPPKRGDIISFIPPVPPTESMVKRVIAVAGDAVEIRERKVYLNGSAQDEPYAVFRRANEQLEGDNLQSLTVPEGAVFVLGDNRDWSDDSRIWRDPQTGERLPFVSTGAIQGIVRGFY